MKGTAAIAAAHERAPKLDPRDVEICWRGGSGRNCDPAETTLRWKLFPHQRRIYDAIFSCARKRFVLNCSRRLGKTFTMMVIAIEAALRKGKARIIIAAPSEKHLEEFVHPIVDVILDDCPEDLKPRWVADKSAYVFKHNKSRIVLAGCDTRTKANRLRGPAADLAIIEEAGMIPDLNYVRRSVIAPQLLSTKGRMLFASTPPDSYGHEFVDIARSNEKLGSYIKLTVYEGHYTTEEVHEFIQNELDDMPLEAYMETEDYRREWLAEFLTDPSRAVLKYATEKHVGSRDTPGTVILRYRNLVRPKYARWYWGLDVGWSPDWTFGIFGYWHHAAKTLVCEREVILKRMSREQLAAEIKRVEAELLGESRRSMVGLGMEEPARWSDYDARLLYELAAEEGLIWSPTAKDDRDTAIDNLNRMIPGFNGHLAINPDGCPMLLDQLMAAVWNKGRTDFSRTVKHGHFDGVASLVYMARNVDKLSDPVPPGMNYDPMTQWVPQQEPLVDPAVKAWGNIFGVA